MAKVPTVYDVAERAGVSIATVSFAFRKPEKVKDSTRELVLAAARQLGYVPSASARGLAHGRTSALGLLAFDYLLETDETPLSTGAAVSIDDPDHPDRTDPNANFRLFPLYVDEVQRGVELECWRQGYALMIGGRGQAATETVLADIAGRVDGLAVFPATVPADALQRIAWRIPVVELSEPDHDDQLSHVTVDNVAGMRAITEHLIAVHRLESLVFVGDTTGSDQQARFQGFRAALRAAGLRVPRKSLCGPGGVINNAAAVVSDLRARGPLPQAAVCATDQEALGADGRAAGGGYCDTRGGGRHRLRRHRCRNDRPSTADHRPPADGADGPRRGRHPDRPDRQSGRTAGATGSCRCESCCGKAAAAARSRREPDKSR